MTPNEAFRLDSFNKRELEERRFAHNGWSIFYNGGRASEDCFTHIVSLDNTLTIEVAYPGYFALTFADLARFDISSQDKVIRVFPFSRDVTEETIRHLLNDQVLPRIFASEGALVLHAGSVLTPEGAVILVGPSGRGKSTLTASLHVQGYPLLGDDAILVSATAAGMECVATYRSLRLFSDSIASVFPYPVQISAGAHYTSKLNVSNLGSDNHLGSPVAVRAIFILGEPVERDIVVRRMEPSEACMGLMEQSFSLDPSDVRRAQTRLDNASKVATQVPVFRIDYPRDFSRIASVHEAIFSAL